MILPRLILMLTFAVPAMAEENPLRCYKQGKILGYPKCPKTETIVPFFTCSQLFPSLNQTLAQKYNKEFTPVPNTHVYLSYLKQDLLATADPRYNKETELRKCLDTVMKKLEIAPYANNKNFVSQVKGRVRRIYDALETPSARKWKLGLRETPPPKPLEEPDPATRGIARSR